MTTAEPLSAAARAAPLPNRPPDGSPTLRALLGVRIPWKYKEKTALQKQNCFLAPPRGFEPLLPP